ncbi:MAG: hypothetical protein LBU17_06305 [Treponema sp.]|jgi:hypothetical protein|nr:hypothetical protein [Treponema sp.]
MTESTVPNYPRRITSDQVWAAIRELGYNFHTMATKGVDIYDESCKRRLTEIDLLLENNECCMAVEVKPKPTEKDIAHHIRQLELLRDCLEKRQQQPKRILGAIAGAVFPEGIQQAVIEAGLYVIEQSGDTMKISVPEGFTPVRGKGGQSKNNASSL